MSIQASVIIPTYSEWDKLQICLDCLARQTVPLDRFEVIVANNNADPEPPPSLRLPANARVVHAPQPGSYAARNVALAQAQADILFFTDSDCQPVDHWIEAGLEAIAPLGPHARIAGEIELFKSDGLWSAPSLYDRLFALRQAEYFAEGWCATANLVVRKACFDLAGPFPDDRFSGGDVQWGKLAYQLGSDIAFSSRTRVRHPVRNSFPELAKKRRRMAGARYYEETHGISPVRPLSHFLIGMPMKRILEACTTPGYTEQERLQIIWIGLRLGWIDLFETIRLRYFGSPPARS